MKARTRAPVIGTIPNGTGQDGVDVVSQQEAVDDHEPARAPQMARMPWYPRDFASATRGWPLIARGGYRELLDVQWDMGSLPGNDVELRQIVGATPTEWKVVWKYIEPKFPVGADGRRRNPRLETHRRKKFDEFDKQSKGGRAGNLIRWGDRQ